MRTARPPTTDQVAALGPRVHREHHGHKRPLLGRSGAHTAHGLPWPAHVRCGRWPPHCPGLSPLARVWRGVEDDVARRQVPGVDAQPHEVGDRLRASDATTLHSLTG
jgi:hypothetical protein